CASVLFSSGSLVWPGLAPAGEVLFFAKEKYPKERRAEVRGPAGFLALLASWGPFAILSAARPSDVGIPDPLAAALLSPAQRQRRERTTLRAWGLSLPRPSGGRVGVRGYASQVAGGNFFSPTRPGSDHETLARCGRPRSPPAPLFAAARAQNAQLCPTQCSAACHAQRRGQSPARRWFLQSGSASRPGWAGWRHSSPPG